MVRLEDLILKILIFIKLSVKNIMTVNPISIEKKCFSSKSIIINE